jgi:hypothetical protein
MEKGLDDALVTLIGYPIEVLLGLIYSIIRYPVTVWEALIQ